jgi:hypothetical protein
MSTPYNHQVPDYKLSLTLQVITILGHHFQHFRHDKALWEFPTECAQIRQQTLNYDHLTSREGVGKVSSDLRFGDTMEIHKVAT